MLVDERDVLGSRPVEHEPLAGRRCGGRRRPAGGQEAAEDEDEDGGQRPACGGRRQPSSSPAGRNVKGRSASEIRVEATQRVRASKTGAMVDGSSSCCSLKRTEPS